MTKFEEEAIKEAEKSKVITKYYDSESTASDIGLNIKLGRATLNFPWLEFAKNWHSDEEFKAEIKKLTDQLITRNDELISSNYEIESLKSQLISREKQVVELRKADKAQVKEIIQLKSQLQQQALPVVPEYVAEWLDSNNLASLLDEWYCHHEDMSSHIREYFERLPYKGPNNLSEMENNIVTFITRAKLGGYKLEKPQLFYLKNTLTHEYLYRKYKTSLGEQSYCKGTDGKPLDYCLFTLDEIESMNTGSYEQIKVEVEK